MWYPWQVRLSLHNFAVLLMNCMASHTKLLTNTKPTLDEYKAHSHYAIAHGQAKPCCSSVGRALLLGLRLDPDGSPTLKHTSAATQNYR
jgi:hypothetical protein